MRVALDFWKSKTTWTSIAAIVTAAGAAATGELNWFQAGASIFVALQAMFIRDAIRKV